MHINATIDHAAQGDDDLTDKGVKIQLPLFTVWYSDSSKLGDGGLLQNFALHERA